MKQQKSGRSVRLVGGPFSGKRLDVPDAGRNVISIRGQKPMSRKEKYKWEYDNRTTMMYGTQNFHTANYRYPRVEAEYRLAMYPGYPGNMPCKHPDGSLFYEYTGNKAEY